jgi:hypothetical protein
MDRDYVRQVLAWSTLINYLILLIWFIAFTAAHDWVYGMHTKWFKLSVEQFDYGHYGGMAIYKLLIMVFNLAPYLAMRLIQYKK